MSSSPHGKIVCADCAQAYRWLPELAGKKVRCKCDGVMLFPDTGPGKGKAVRAAMKSHGKPKAPAAPKPPADEAGPSSNDSTSSVTASKSGSPVAGGSSIAAGTSSSSSLPLDDDFDLDLDLGGGGVPPAGDMIDIRAAEEVPPPAAEAPPATPAGNTCPSCKATLKPGAVLCVQCGFNLKKGKLTASKVSGGGGGTGEGAEGVPGGSTGGLFARLTRGLRRKS
ncbi:MAG: hypothetical protein K8S99_03275 [Planctomycetes bacterium]|nr:hypothetical protein [Planctomycetota bacterium]